MSRSVSSMTCSMMRAIRFTSSARRYWNARLRQVALQYSRGWDRLRVGGTSVPQNKHSLMAAPA
jgi:hypothetical protein